MTTGHIENVNTLAFDLFGTVLDLTSSLVPMIEYLIAPKRNRVPATTFWAKWRARQRIEQYQDTLLMQGHGGYLETCRRALVYTAELLAIQFTNSEVERLVKLWRELKPFPDSVRGLEKLRGQYRIVALSNGEPWLLDHLEKRIGIEFHSLLSVELAGVFKPHPAVYRTAARTLGTEPSRIMMVAAHSFDVMGAQASGYRGAYVNRYHLPYEVSQYEPDLEVADLDELATRLL